MKILLDECVPRKFKRSFSDHECLTVPDAKLSGVENGELLRRAEQNGFQVFLTIDKGFEFEQNLRGRSLAVLVIRVKSSKLKDLLVYVPEILERLRSIRPGQAIRVGED
jgi:predicted nuclease of predicted toxin-antitoxin system